MAIVDRNTLKGRFRRGLKPLASQFADWIDSFWHKSERIPVSAIQGLENTLAGINNWTVILDRLDGKIVEEAPIDGKLYGRKNGAWVEITEAEIGDIADFNDDFNNDFLIEF